MLTVLRCLPNFMDDIIVVLLTLLATAALRQGRTRFLSHSGLSAGRASKNFTKCSMRPQSIDGMTFFSDPPFPSISSHTFSRISRHTGGADRIKAARDVLEFNGYDITQLVMR